MDAVADIRSGLGQPKVKPLCISLATLVSVCPTAARISPKNKRRFFRSTCLQWLERSLRSTRSSSSKSCSLATHFLISSASGWHFSPQGCCRKGVHRGLQLSGRLLAMCLGCCDAAALAMNSAVSTAFPQWSKLLWPAGEEGERSKPLPRQEPMRGGVETPTWISSSISDWWSLSTPLTRVRDRKKLYKHQKTYAQFINKKIKHQKHFCT